MRPWKQPGNLRFGRHGRRLPPPRHPARHARGAWQLRPSWAATPGAARYRACRAL